MRPFDLEHLRSFVITLESGSLSVAAPKLHRSQSALSEQLRKLETFTGVTLLQRGKKGVSPTPAGERLLVHARQLLALSDGVLEDMRGATLTGELRLAITDYFLPSAIANLLKGLRTRYPQLRLHVSVRKSLQIESKADSGEFDIGLSMRILDGRSLPEGIVVRREALRWVAVAGFEAQAPLPLVVLPQDCRLQRFATDQLDAHGVPYVVAHSASGVGGLQSALLAGLGVACLNHSAVPTGAEVYQAHGLPALPQVEFSLLPARPGEAPLVSAVREMLVTHFSQWLA
ncbi:MAG: Hca operon transcriptional activator HcaR [Pseudomonas sp.]|nr:MAG: Hca operon transcriptional activator HcaR [Pseudomonas sp.]